MNIFRRYLMTWLYFTFLFTLAAFFLDLFEGNKITTTEYYGLRNLGFAFVISTVLFVFILYPVSFLLLTIFLNRFLSSFITRIIIYAVAGGLSGIWAFNKLYDYQNDYFIKGYDLNISTSIILFALAGLIYGFFDSYLKKKSLS